MSVQTMTLSIPSGLFNRLQKRAEQAHRTVEDETLELLTATVSVSDIPEELEQALASLQLLDDSAIKNAARSRLPAELSTELETLHLKQQREGLTESESQRSSELIRAYERAMLIRASAAALMRERGIGVACLVDQP